MLCNAHLEEISYTRAYEDRKGDPQEHYRTVLYGSHLEVVCSRCSSENREKGPPGNPRPLDSEKMTLEWRWSGTGRNALGTLGHPTTVHTTEQYCVVLTWKR